MSSIWIAEIVFKPAGPLTFRQMPSGLLHIMSYPFMPPTTMSGFLKRLMSIATGSDWPGYGEDWFGQGPGKEFTLTLGPEYRALGAYPKPANWMIHKTRRHGPKNFNHKEFSQIARSSHKENYQLHHWDYLFCDQLTGWVAAQTGEHLEALHALKNFGGKAGKEGYLILEKIGSPVRLNLAEGPFRPLGLVTPPARPATGTFFNLYGHHWDGAYEWSNGERGGVTGYRQVGAWWLAERVVGPYWALEEGIGFQADMPDAFMEVEENPFFSL
jgi:hypothetical protein